MRIGRAIRGWDMIWPHKRHNEFGYNDLASSPIGSTRMLCFSASYKEGRDKTLFPYSSRKTKNMVTLLVGDERQAFRVEPQILEHGVVQCLLERTKVGEFTGFDHRSGAEEGCFILLDCDAILFEHILWLLHNNDPSLRNLNLDELMEFYN